MTDSVPPPKHVTIPLDLGKLQVPYLVVLQHILDVLAVSMSGVDLVSDEMYSSFLPTFFNVGTAPAAKLPAEDARSETRRWLLTNAFRDAVDATGLFLDGVRETARALIAASAGTLTGALLREITTAEAAEFKKLGIGKKVQGLREHIGCELAFYEVVFSINAVRNCLVHRRGVVSAEDVDSAGCLVLKYGAFELFTSSADGSNEVIVDKPTHVEGGTRIFIRRVERSRAFRVGDRIDLSVDEINHVFATLMQFSMTTVVELERIAGAQRPQSTAAP